jgi:hypothetical protein
MPFLGIKMALDGILGAASSQDENAAVVFLKRRPSVRTDMARSSAKYAKGFKLEDLVALSIVLSNLDVVKALMRLRWSREKT